MYHHNEGEHIKFLGGKVLLSRGVKNKLKPRTSSLHTSLLSMSFICQLYSDLLLIFQLITAQPCC
jgi:hypothetical protein